MKQTSTSTQTTAFDLDALSALVGSIAVREFEQSLDAFKADLFSWAQTLPDMLDSNFVQNASAAVYDSANMSRFRGMEHMHFKASAFYHESERRFTLAHPDEDCNASSLYERAYNRAVRDAGQPQMASDVRACTCATTNEG